MTTNRSWSQRLHNTVLGRTIRRTSIHSIDNGSNWNGSQRGLSPSPSAETIPPPSVTHLDRAPAHNLSHSDGLALRGIPTEQPSTKSFPPSGPADKPVASPNKTQGSAGETVSSGETLAPTAEHTLAGNPKAPNAAPPKDIRHATEARTTTPDNSKEREAEDRPKAPQVDAEAVINPDKSPKITVVIASGGVSGEHEDEAYTTAVEATASHFSIGSVQPREGLNLEPVEAAKTASSKVAPALEHARRPSDAGQPVDPSSTSARKPVLSSGTPKESIASMPTESPHVPPTWSVPDTTVSGPTEGLVKRSWTRLKGRRIKENDNTDEDVVIVPIGAGKSSDFDDHEKPESIADTASDRPSDEPEPEAFKFTNPVNPTNPQFGTRGGSNLGPGANAGSSNILPALQNVKGPSNSGQPLVPPSTRATKPVLPAESPKGSTAPVPPEHVEPVSSVPDTAANGPADSLVKRSLAFAGGFLKARRIKDNDINQDDVVIVIMGPTGAGKSSFISIASALDDKETVQVGHSLNSCTSEISMYRISCPLLLDKDIVLVDTPGFDDTNVSDADTLKSVSKWLEARYKAQTKLAGILYFHRISDNRMAGTPLKNLRMFQKLCGEDSLQKVTLVTTMWDMVESEEVGMVRLKELCEDPKFWKAMIEHGSEVKRFNYNFASALEVLRRTTGPLKLEHDEALKAELEAGPKIPQYVAPKSRKSKRQEKKKQANPSQDGAQNATSPIDQQVVQDGTTLRIQEELVDEHKELRATEAGKILFSKLQELVEKRQAVLDRLKEEIDLGGKEGIPETVLVSLTKELEELQKEFDVAQKELETLKITIGDRLAGWLRAGRSIGMLGSLLRKLVRKKSVIKDTPAKSK